jgi:flavin reductase (DIM6/NTAB) family NADH-FMN oxidoreductase RutF
VRRVPPDELRVKPFTIFDRQWALLVGGSARPNPMTVSWGGLGTLWNRPVATVYVRPTRFTFGLLEAERVFTLNFLPERYRAALDLCGAVSGRDLDKWHATGLGKARSATVPVPRVAEAELALECRVLATLEVDPQRFLEPAIADLYPRKDYHRVFLGEVLAAFADERFLESRS